MVMVAVGLAVAVLAEVLAAAVAAAVVAVAVLADGERNHDYFSITWHICALCTNFSSSANLRGKGEELKRQ
jgi:hypothetical protein